MYGSAQYTMTDADLPQIGDSRVYYGLDTTGINEGPGGTGLTWDFSGGNTTSQTRILNVVAASSHPQGGSFPNSTLALDFSNGTYRFYTVNSNFMTYDGEVSLVNTPIPYDSTPVVYNFPLNYLDISQDTIAAYYNTGAAGFAFRNGNHNTIFDASGTLILPNGISYGNTNRLVTFIQVKDSSQVFPLVTDITVTRVEWYQQGVTVPVMWTESSSVAVNGGNPTFTREIWYTDTAFVAVDDALVVAEMSLFPNPAQNQVRVSFELQGSADVNIDVFSMVGEKVQTLNLGEMGAGSYQEVLETQGLSRGMYFVRLNAGGTVSTQKLILK